MDFGKNYNAAIQDKTYKLLKIYLILNVATRS